MPDQIPVAEMNRAVTAAKQAHAGALRDFERNINQIISGLEKSADQVNKDAKRIGEIGTLRTIESALNESKNKAMRSIGLTIKMVRVVGDSLLSLQDQYNALRKELMLTSAASTQMGKDLDQFVKVGITEASNLRSALHITQGEWDSYLKAYRKYAMTLDEMNTQVLSGADKVAKSVTRNIFDISKRYELDVVKVTEAFASTLTRGGAVGEDVADNAKEVLDAWRSVAAGAKMAGSSTTKAFDLISGIAVGTEQEVSSGSKRILGLSNLYGNLFKMLKDNQQQGLIEDYFKAIESGLRSMSVESAALFSGVMWGTGIGGSNALEAAMNMKAMIRTLKDPRTNRDVSPSEIIGLVSQQIMVGSNATKIVTEDMVKSASGIQKDALTEVFMKQQVLVEQFLPGLSRGQQWTVRGVLAKFAQGQYVSQEELKDAMKAMTLGEEGEAREIQDQKTSFMAQISDMIAAWAAKKLFGAPDTQAVQMKNATEMFVVQNGTKEEFVQQRLADATDASKEERARRRAELEKMYDRQKTDFLRKNVLYNRETTKKLNPEMITILKIKGEQIAEKIATKLAAGDKRYAALLNPQISPTERANVMDRAIKEDVEETISTAKTSAERDALREAFGSQSAIDIMNTQKQAEIVPRKDFFGRDKEPTVVSAPAKEPYDIKARVDALIDQKKKAEEREQAARKQAAPAASSAPPLPQAFSGMLNTTEGELRQLHEGEMIIPRNQADIIRSMGGPLAFLQLLKSDKNIAVVPPETGGADVNAPVLDYMRSIISSMAMLEGGIKRSRDVLVMNLFVAQPGDNAVKAISGLVDNLQVFSSNIARASGETHISRAQEGKTATEGQRMSWSPLEFLFGKSAAEEVRKSGGVTGAVANASKAGLAAGADAKRAHVNYKTSTKQEFISLYGNALAKAGFPPHLIPAALAQMAVETGWGQHFVPGSNNPGNIQAGTAWKGPVVSYTDHHAGGQAYRAQFRKYATLEEGIAAYADLIKGSKRYKRAIGSQSPEEYIREIGRSGYAEATNYTSALSSAHQSIAGYIRKEGMVDKWRQGQGVVAAAMDVASEQFGKLDEAMRDKIEESKKSEVGRAAVGLAKRALNVMGLTEYASSILPAFTRSLEPDKPKVGMETAVRTDEHVLTVPLLLADGTSLSAMCTINFQTTTITEITDNPGYDIS